MESLKERHNCHFKEKDKTMSEDEKSFREKLSTDIKTVKKTLYIEEYCRRR